MPVKWKIGPLIGGGSGLYIVHLLALLKQLQCCMEVDRLEFLSGQFHKICSTGWSCHAALLFKCPEVGDSPLCVVLQCIFGHDFLSPRTTIVLGIENHPSACMSCCSDDLALLLLRLDL